VESDNAQEAIWWKPEMVRSPGQPVRYLPLALDLFYLVSAYAEGSYAEEQQAMSVALRIFHENAVVRSGPPSPPAPGPLDWQLTLTMEHRSYDELSRLWQATTAPLRLGVVYRAAAVFLAPERPEVAAKPVQEVDLYVKQPLDAPLADADLVKVTRPS
jgi:Pvc16 N-terminal domain